MHYLTFRGEDLFNHSFENIHVILISKCFFCNVLSVPKFTVKLYCICLSIPQIILK